MCACEKAFAQQFLSHQLHHATDSHSREHIPVTHGFIEGICNACRGLPPQSCPKKPQYGQTSKVYRFYWREISFETISRFGTWMTTKGLSHWLVARGQHKEVFESIEKQVVEEIKRKHQHSPKYDYSEESSADLISKYNVEVLKLDGSYIRGQGKGMLLSLNGKPCSPESYAAHHFGHEGYDVIQTESRPFHVLFGVFMWLLIQDTNDPKIRNVGFGKRVPFSDSTNSPFIHTLLPSDFGSREYARRRASAIEVHFQQMLSLKKNLLWAFDYWTEPSNELRNYLWAHMPEDLSKARRIVEVLPACTIIRILRFLTAAYWDRYCGWPDLLIYKGSQFQLVEVKSSRDKLSEQQKQWIRENYKELGLPFKLVKIHRTIEVD